MSSDKILAVDLDGTLLKTDILHESIAIYLKYNILNIFTLILWAIKGRLILKKKLAENVSPNIKNLPYNNDVISYIKKRKLDGYKIILVTATIESIALNISKHLNIFDKVIASNKENLSGKNKEQRLVDIYGKGKYEYIGNSVIDLHIWKSASKCHFVNCSHSLISQVEKSKLGKIFPRKINLYKSFFSALRLHQWIKNILIFVPLAAAHKLFDMNLIMNGIIAFISFGMCASSVYLLNDLLDIEDDRNHEEKRMRQLAAGNLSIPLAIISIPMLISLSLLISYIFLPIGFMVILLIYILINLFYSIQLKKIVLIDLFLLAFLYTLRLIAGAESMLLETTFWIITFSMFIFLSLAVVKRFTELLRQSHIKQNANIKVRGYSEKDLSILLTLGLATGLISVLILALYINEVSQISIYPQEEILWLSCPLLFYWISRVWFLTSRGVMNYDPVIFALKDNQSRLIGILFLSVFLLAAI